MNRALFACLSACALTMLAGDQLTAQDEGDAEPKLTRYYVTVFPPRDADRRERIKPPKTTSTASLDQTAILAQEDEAPGAHVFSGLSRKPPIVTKALKSDYYIVAWRVQRAPLRATQSGDLDRQHVSFVSQQGFTRVEFLESLRPPRISTERPAADEITDLSGFRPIPAPKKARAKSDDLLPR